jgi:hypothetical protein
MFLCSFTPWSYSRGYFTLAEWATLPYRCESTSSRLWLFYDFFPYFFSNLWHPNKTRFYVLTNMETMRNFEFTSDKCTRNLNCWKLFTENDSFNCQFILLASVIMRPHSSVRCYGQDDGCIRVRFLVRNATAPWPALVPAQPSSLFGIEFLSRRMKLATHLHLGPRLWILGVILPLPHACSWFGP